jgi:adenylate cyclase
VHGKIDLTYEDIGEQQLKNIARAMRVYRLNLSGSNAAIARPGDHQIQLALPDKPSIAVLAFANMSGNPDQDAASRHSG